MRFDAKYFDQVTAKVAEVERQTAAEVVVTVHPYSGNYRDVDYLVGGILAMAGLAFILFNPWTEHSHLVLPIDLGLLALMGAILSAGLPAMRRLLTTRKRRQQQVRDAAAVEFLRCSVGHTMQRTGILLYLSVMERELDLIADIGIQAAIPDRYWRDCQALIASIPRASNPQEALLLGIEQMGAVLAKYLPPRAGDVNELPDRPRTKE
jgi:putative membrane protein